MKLMLALGGVILAVCPAAPAQEWQGDRVVVPARNSTRPRKLDVRTLNGSVTVRVYGGKDVIVEGGRSSASPRDRESGGMHRIDSIGRGLIVEEEDNTITVRSEPGREQGITIQVPADTSLRARTTSGTVEAEGLSGELDVSTTNGRIALTNVSGSVVAHALNGSIRVTMNRLDQSKPSSFSTLNGPIEVTLPGDIKANLKLNSHHGEIWTDFDVRLGGAVSRPNNTSDGKFRLTADRNMAATINGGGVELSFYTLNGRITIHKK